MHLEEKPVLQRTTSNLAAHGGGGGEVGPGRLPNTYGRPTLSLMSLARGTA